MLRRTFTAAAVLLLSAALSAQTADEIIAKNIQALGGLAKLKAIQSVRVTGDFEAAGMQAGFTQTFKRPLKMRADILVGGLTVTQAFDGQNGWQIVPFTGKKDAEPMAADDLKTVKEEADFDGPLMDYQQKGNKVELVGKEKLEGTDVYHLKVTLKNGDVRNIFLDADSFLAIKTVAKTTVRGNEVELEIAVGDYKSVDGIMFPFSVEQRSTGGQMPGQKITFKKVEFNVPVDDSIFKMPAPAPPPAADKPASSGDPKSNNGSKPPQN